MSVDPAEYPLYPHLRFLCALVILAKKGATELNRNEQEYGSRARVNKIVVVWCFVVQHYNTTLYYTTLCSSCVLLLGSWVAGAGNSDAGDEMR